MLKKSNFGKALLIIVSFFLVMSMVAVVPIQALSFTHESSFYDGCTRYGLLIVIVRDADGKPVAGAEVNVYNSDDIWEKSGTTRKYGRYFTILPRGEYYVTAEKNGLETKSDVFYLRFFKRVVLILEPGCVPEPEICDGLDNDCDGLVDEGVTITVTWKNNGPVEGAEIEIINPLDIQVGLYPSATNEEGKVKWCQDDPDAPWIEPGTGYMAKAYYPSDTEIGNSMFNIDADYTADVSIETIIEKPV